MAGNKKRTRFEWEVEINTRAWKDPEFKKELLKNPRKTLEKLGCAPTLDPEKVKILEETENSHILILHRQPNQTKSLSLEELESLEGGSSPVFCTGLSGLC